MTDPSVTHQVGSLAFTIDSSSAFIAVFSADINPLGEEGFNLIYPDSVAGVTATLTHIDTSGPTDVRSAPVAVPPGGAVSHYNIGAGPAVPVGGSSLELSVNIDEQGGGVVTGELWELRVSASAATTWSLNLSSGNVEVQWLAADPVAGLTPMTALELQAFTLTARGARAANTIFGTPPGDLVPRYTWSYTGAAPIQEISNNPGTPTTTTGPTLPISTPGVYEPVTLQFSVKTGFVDNAGTYTGFLQNSATAPMAISQRRQEIVLVLDRSGSMASESRYDNAKIASRVLLHLFDGLRDGVNVGDRVAIIAFEDETAGFRGGKPSGRIQTLLPLTPLPDAVTAIDNGTVDFGAPGANTPIGDGLIAAVDLLGQGAGGVITDQKFTIILLTDGQENSGTVAVVPTSAINGAISLQTAVSSSSLRQAVLDPVRCTLSAIALGPTADQNVLSQLVAPFHGGKFTLTTNAGELAGKFGDMLANTQTVNAVTRQATPTTGVADPDAPPSPAVLPAVYFSNEPDNDRLVLAVTPPAGQTVITDTIQLARWDGTTYVPEAITVHASESDRATSVAKLPVLAGGHPMHWRVLHGPGPAGALPLAVDQVLVYVDLHLLADVILDQPAYRTGDRMTLTVRIRQDDAPILGATVTATLDAPAVGLGQQLTALSDVQVSSAVDEPDVPTWLERRVGTLLTKHKWHALPRTHPTGGLFVDNTDRLPDPEGDGNYTNTFAQVFKEGTYTWHLTVAGSDVNGNPFTRVLTISTFASVKVDPKATKIKVTRVHDDPSGLSAALVSILPQDKRGEDLGPGHDDEVIWALADGTFQHVLNHQPAPVLADGTYQRTVLFTNHQHPELRVKAAKVLLPEIDVRRRLLGFN